MNNNEEQKLKSEFVKMGMEVSPTNEAMSFEEIADYWLNKMKDEREKMIEIIKEKQTTIKLEQFTVDTILDIIKELKNK